MLVNVVKRSQRMLKGCRDGWAHQKWHNDSIKFNWNNNNIAVTNWNACIWSIPNENVYAYALQYWFEISLSSIVICATTQDAENFIVHTSIHEESFWKMMSMCLHHIEYKTAKQELSFVQHQMHLVIKLNMNLYWTEVESLQLVCI